VLACNTATSCGESACRDWEVLLDMGLGLALEVRRLLTLCGGGTAGPAVWARGRKEAVSSTVGCEHACEVLSSGRFPTIRLALRGFRSSSCWEWKSIFWLVGCFVAGVGAAVVRGRDAVGAVLGVPGPASLWKRPPLWFWPRLRAPHPLCDWPREHPGVHSLPEMARPCRFLGWQADTTLSSRHFAQREAPCVFNC
jgi:hypothetical protein